MQCSNFGVFTYGDFHSNFDVNDSQSTTAVPSEQSTYYSGNPGSFSVSGTIFAASQEKLNDTPNPLPNDGSTNILSLDYNFDTSQGEQQTFTPGGKFTCPIFDGSTLLGSASGTVSASATSSGDTGDASCEAVYPPSANLGQFGTSNGLVFVTLPSSNIDTANPYTIVLSH